MNNDILIKERDRLTTEASVLNPSLDKKMYNDYMDAIIKIDKILAMDKELTKKPEIDMNVIIPVAGNLLGIAMILVFEKSDIITSKAINFVHKIRL